MSKVFAILIAALALPSAMPSMLSEALGNSGIKTITRGNAAFALDLYGELKEEEGNLFFSPYSISTVLAMTYAGARGNTEKQMAEVLHITLDQKRLHPAFARLEAHLNTLQNKGGIQLSVANALWAQKDYVFLREFLDLTEKNYGAVLNHVDFKRALEVTRREINAWVEKKTRKKIKDLIKPGVLDTLTRLVLTNAIYFKGNWASQFNKKATKNAPFWVAPDNRVEIPMMVQEHEFSYMENDILQVLELPYVRDDLSMIVLLPKKVDGLAELENLLGVENLNGWLSHLEKHQLLVYFPRFKIGSAISLSNTLASMGMPDAFDQKEADFSGMVGRKELYISAVVHKAFVDVNEEGTEAAAATGVFVGVTSMLPPVFRADHPFIFLIRDNHSRSILFLGRVVNPLE